MRRPPVRLWAAILVEAGAAALAIALGAVGVAASPAAPVLGIATALALFSALTGEAPWRLRCRRDRWALVAAKSGVIAVKAASEEVVWRGLALGRLAALTGTPVAAVLATAGFALAHGRGRRAAVHVATGGAFAALFLAASLVAAIVAHCAYNALVVLAVERERRRG